MRKSHLIQFLGLICFIFTFMFAVNAEAITVDMGETQWLSFDFTDLTAYNSIAVNGPVTNPDVTPELETWLGDLEIYDEISDAAPVAFLSSTPHDNGIGLAFPSSALPGLFDDPVFYIKLMPTSWDDDSSNTYYTPIDFNLIAYASSSSGIFSSNVPGVPVSPVPEPATMLLLGFGLLGLWGLRRKFKT